MIWLIVFGFSYGLLAAAGVFTVFVAVGLVPRFAGRTHTAKYILVYEEMVIYGTLLGALVSLFPEGKGLVLDLWRELPVLRNYRQEISMSIQIVYGVSAGVFIGCLALAIAEMLDSIPIFTRRVSFRFGIGIAVLCIAVGKLIGSLVYFMTGLGENILIM